jgi:plastocyanin
MANNNQILLILPIVLALTIHLATTEIFAQTGSMATLQNIDATYAVSIVPGAAQKDNTYHYYPPQIAVPTGTTIAWFNNDFGQPHTVTSGEPGDVDKGSIFNSGIMPATANSFFQFTFDQPGKFLYHCIIHPWRVASVSVNDTSFTATSFDIGLGSEQSVNYLCDRYKCESFDIGLDSGSTWDLSSNPRVLMDISPKTVLLDRTTPITYNVTINEVENNNSKTLFSDLFTTAGQPLPLELVSGLGNETISYGPDFSSTGAYHVQSDFKKGSSYAISVEIVSVNYKPVEFPIRATFNLPTSS